MSRTIRRQRDKRKNKCSQTYFSDISYWTHVRDYSEDGTLVWTKKPGKDYQRGWWRYHSDRIKGWSYSKDARKETHRSSRIKNNLELVRYFKDEDYEVLVHEPRDLSHD